MRSKLLWIWILAGFSVAEVHAGAWTLPEDKGQLILSTSRTVAPVRAVFGENIDFDKNSAQLFLEYGLWSDVTVGVTAFGEFSTTDDIVETRAGAHVRHRLWTGEDGDVISVQAGFSLPAESLLGGSLGDSRPFSAPEYDIRLLYGRGWQWELGNSFISSELGFRMRGESLDDQIKLDITAGHEPVKGVLGLMSIFTSVPLGGDTDTSLKISPSIAYTLWPWLGENEKKPWQPISPDTVQLGVTWDALQPENGLEMGVSIWRSF